MACIFFFSDFKKAKHWKGEIFCDFFLTIYTPNFLKFVPCFIDIHLKYKNHLTKFSDSFPLLPSLSKLALLKKVLEVVDSPGPKRYTFEIKNEVDS